MRSLEFADEIRFDTTDFEYKYQNIADRFDIDLTDEDTFDRFKRLFRRCYNDEEIVIELLGDAFEAGKVKEFLTFASFVVFRDEDDKRLLKKYLEYKAPFYSVDYIDDYVETMTEEELQDYLLELNDF